MKLELLKTREARAWGLLLLFSLAARLAGLGVRALSHDESLHAVYSRYLAGNFHYQHDPMMHGPLLFHLNALVYSILGISDFTARLIPALAGTACVGAAALYRRWLGKAGAFAAAALISIHPGLLYYSRYIRNDIYISLFTLLMLWAVLRYLEEGKPKHLIALGISLGLSFACKEVCFIHGFVLGCTLLLLHLLSRFPQSQIPLPNSEIPSRSMDLALILLTLALPFATPLLHRFIGWDPLDSRSATGQTRTFALALGMSALSASTAIVWFGTGERLRVWMRAMGCFWTIQLLLYTTLLTNIRQGLASGIAGSLGYWLAQHEVRRGSPDPLFYLSLLLLYEPLLLLTAGPGLRRLRFLPALFIGLCFAGHLVIYSWAGERMPWLLVHISLPLCLLAGPALAHAFSRRTRLRFAYAPLLALLLINSLRLNGPLAESVDEPLVYAHAGPKLKTAVRTALAALERHPDSVLLSHGDFAWPLVWYFRETPVRYTDDFTDIPPEVSVLLVRLHEPGFHNNGEWVERGAFVMTDWPRQHWHALTPDNFHALLTRPSVQRRFLNFYFFRRLPERGPADFPAPNRFRLLTRV